MSKTKPINEQGTEVKTLTEAIMASDRTRALFITISGDEIDGFVERVVTDESDNRPFPRLIIMELYDDGHDCFVRRFLAPILVESVTIYEKRETAEASWKEEKEEVDDYRRKIKTQKDSMYDRIRKLTAVDDSMDIEADIAYEYENDEEDGWQEVGVCTVDAGMVWFGDPCYFIPRTLPDGRYMKDSALQDYDKFLSEIDKFRKVSKIPGAIEFDHDNGIAGLGVLLDNFGGDGVYKVYIKKDENGLTKEAKIVFWEDEE